MTPNDRSRGESCVDLVHFVIYEVREMEMELVGIQRILTRGKRIEPASTLTDKNRIVQIRGRIRVFPDNTKQGWGRV